MDYFLYNKSDENDVYFSDNHVYRFKLDLNRPLTKNDKWIVALIDFNVVDASKSRTKTADGLYIYTDLCKESVVHGAEQPLLRQKIGWNYMFNKPYYLPVKKKGLQEFQIYIKLGDGSYPVTAIRRIEFNRIQNSVLDTRNLPI
jgi:hypothetical protein